MTETPAPPPGYGAPPPGYGVPQPVPPPYFIPGPGQAAHPGYGPAGYAPAGYAPPGYPPNAYPPGYAVPGPGAHLIPPGPAPGLAYVGFWHRTGGYLIDVVILLIPLILIISAFSHETASLEAGVVVKSRAIDAAGYLVAGFATMAYFGGSWYAFSRTIGQRMVDIRVVRAIDGGALDGAAAAKRAGYLAAGTLVGAIHPALGSLVGLLLFVGLAMLAADPRKQGWHDKLAQTVVIKRWP